MKKLFLMFALASICLVSAIVPVQANDGIIIAIRPAPSPTPTPKTGDDIGGRGTAIGEVKDSGGFLGFWEFLENFF